MDFSYFYWLEKVAELALADGKLDLPIQRMWQTPEGPWFDRFQAGLTPDQAYAKSLEQAGK